MCSCDELHTDGPQTPGSSAALPSSLSTPQVVYATGNSDELLARALVVLAVSVSSLALAVMFGGE